MNNSIYRLNWKNLSVLVKLVRIGSMVSRACRILVICCLMKTTSHIPPCALGFIDYCWRPTPGRRSTTSHAAVSRGQVVAKLSDGPLTNVLVPFYLTDLLKPERCVFHDCWMNWNQATWRWLSPIEKRWCVSNYCKSAGSVQRGREWVGDGLLLSRFWRRIFTNPFNQSHIGCTHFSRVL